MRLLRVEIHGFKSFSDRTSLEFPSGLTAIVGPNGCGKSNVIDAVKWALGEQRASALRGAEMLDVIFKGNGARPARNFAEVSLVFDNADGKLPIDYSEVVITRRLFRSGESEYLVNRQVVRLKDVRNLLMDTGLGTGAYSVMEQGRIDAVLSANPTERRRIFEEAAGISRYRQRRRESESKLERTEQNLLRLGDVVEELEKQQRSLKQQAGRARSFLAARDRLAELRSTYFVHQWWTLGDTLAEQEREQDRLEEAERAGKTALEESRQRVTLLQDRLATVRAAVDEAAEAFRQASGEVEALGERQVALRERQTELDERCQILAARIEGLTAAVEERRREVASVDERLTELTAEAGTWAATEGRAAELVASAESERAAWRSRVEEERAAALQRLGELTEGRNRRASAESGRAALVASRDRIGERQAELMRQIEEQTALQGELFAGARDLQAALEQAQAQCDQRRVHRTALQEAVARLDDELLRSREGLAGADSRHAAIEELIARRDGVSPGAITLLESGLAGIDGLLVDHLRAPQELAEAVETALGATTQAVLVASRAHGLEALQYLRSNRGGRVLIVPRDDVRPRTCRAAGERLLDRLDVLDHAEVFEALLGHVRLVPDNEALAACRPDGVTVWVTPDGDLLDERGILRGGTTGEEDGLVTRRAEKDALAARCSRLRAETEELTTRRGRAAHEVADVDEALGEAEAQLRRIETERERTRERERQSTARREALERERQLRQAELGRLTGELEEVDATLAVALERERELDALVRADQEQEARSESRSHELAAQLAQRQEELAAARLETAARRERIEALDSERRQVERGLQERADNLQLTRNEITELGERRERLDTDLAELLQRAEQLTQQRDQRAGALNESRASAGTLGQELSVAQEVVGQREEAVTTGSETLAAHRLRSQETSIRRDELRRQVVEELEIDLSGAERPDEAAEETDWDAIAHEIEELRTRVARMSNVNLAAVEELDEVEERLTFLVGQRDDLNEARRSLADTIHKVNRESRQRFLDAFEEVRDHFRVIFRKLFRGGRADIQLEEGEDVLEAGIEIMAAPPGKDARSITLLSGGERTLTAVGLLFALFRAKPSPVCLLDEVDAALDETNIDRFCAVLEDFLGQSQFLVVTHARRTMGFADMIYGVTMQEHGVSKVLSIALADFDAGAENAEARTETVASRVSRVAATRGDRLSGVGDLGLGEAEAEAEAEAGLS